MVVLISIVLISILCFLPLLKGGPGREGRRRVRWKVRFEMQDVSFERFAFWRLEDCIMLIKLDDAKRAFEFCSQFSVFVQKIMNSHQHLLIEFEVVDTCMLVVGSFLDDFLIFTVQFGLDTQF